VPDGFIAPFAIIFFTMAKDEFCAIYDGNEFCASGDVLLIAIVIELMIYLIVFVGGWELLKIYFRNKRKNRNPIEEELGRNKRF
jgi:hypothetical protein